MLAVYMTIYNSKSWMYIGIYLNKMTFFLSVFILRYSYSDWFNLTSFFFVCVFFDRHLYLNFEIHFGECLTSILMFFPGPTRFSFGKSFSILQSWQAVAWKLVEFCIIFILLLFFLIKKKKISISFIFLRLY